MTKYNPLHFHIFFICLQVLCMHYLVGQGANTLTDGFAAAEKLRKDDPKAFELLGIVYCNA